MSLYFSQQNRTYSKFAFTLAEVLITLGIIGIVAALTIPALIQQQQDKATVTALKKAFTNFSQAYTLAVQNNGTPETWASSGGGSGGENILNVLAPYLKIVKNCGRNAGCFPDNGKFINNAAFNINTYVPDAKAQLTDGSLIYAWAAPSCGVVGTSPALQSACGDLGVDINGFKGPNQLGVDTFTFFITKSGIVPYGAQQSSVNTFDADCKNKTTQGFGCAAWVIYNENLDYLKCGASLSWGGPTSCP